MALDAVSHLNPENCACTCCKWGLHQGGARLLTLISLSGIQKLPKRVYASSATNRPRDFTNGLILQNAGIECQDTINVLSYENPMGLPVANFVS